MCHLAFVSRVPSRPSFSLIFRLVCALNFLAKFAVFATFLYDFYTYVIYFPDAPVHFLLSKDRPMCAMLCVALCPSSFVLAYSISFIDFPAYLLSLPGPTSAS